MERTGWGDKVFNYRCYLIDIVILFAMYLIVCWVRVLRVILHWFWFPEPSGPYCQSSIKKVGLYPDLQATIAKDVPEFALLAQRKLAEQPADQLFVSAEQVPAYETGEMQ